MSRHDKTLALVAQNAALRTENALLQIAAVTIENAELRVTVERAAASAIGTQNYRALIRRRAKKLAARGKPYDALILLKSIGE